PCSRGSLSPFLLIARKTRPVIAVACKEEGNEISNRGPLPSFAVDTAVSDESRGASPMLTNNRTSADRLIAFPPDSQSNRALFTDVDAARRIVEIKSPVLQETGR